MVRNSFNLIHEVTGQTTVDMRRGLAKSVLGDRFGQVQELLGNFPAHHHQDH